MSQSILAALIAFLLGAVSVWGYYQLQKGDEHLPSEWTGMGSSRHPMFDPIEPSWPPFSSFFDRSLFDGNLFDERVFDGPLFNGSGPMLRQIERIERSDQIQYRIPLHGQKLENLDVSNNNGQLTVMAELSSDVGNQRSRSTLRQSFPVPGDVDPASLRVEQTDDAVLIEFDRTS